MKILVVSHPPLTAELGAAQIATNLAAALRRRGHDAQAWSPEPLPRTVKWWNVSREQRDSIARHAATTGPYDIVDTPAISATPELARHGRVVVRSVQPELLYLRSALNNDLRRPSPRALVHTLLSLAHARAIRRGWEVARLILCLGTIELDWMQSSFPRWRAKLGFYVSAVPESDRRELLRLRAQRERREGSGVRFLWLGRWTAHKGTARLLTILRERFARCPDDFATIGGCGPMARREIPGDWLASGRVRLVESYRRSELGSLLETHDAGLFTSEVEGWGLSLAEMLESGLPVFATEAGAVPDLRPFFPSSLRPLPIPDRPAVGQPEDLAANGYLDRFDWHSIAADYERQVMTAC